MPTKKGYVWAMLKHCLRKTKHNPLENNSLNTIDNPAGQRTIHTKTAPYKVSRLAEQHKRFTLTILG